jgi:hypothetical protein
MRNNRASWAAAVALAVGVTSGASAADLGGNCCADLEERIAELEATTARKGNRKVSLEVSGWLNKSLLFWDDSIRSDVYVVDNNAAQSRFRFTGNATITADVRAGFVYEFGQHGSQSNAVDQGNGGAIGGIGVGDDGGFGPQLLRQANVWLESKRLGKVTLGYASQATDGIAEIDLSRTEVVSGSGVDTWVANFVDVVNGSYASGVNRIMYFHFLGNFDGGRDQLIRYDSPAIAGFQFSASMSGGSLYPCTFGAVCGVLPPGGPKEKEWDVALRYAAEWNGVRFAAGVGYHIGMVADGVELINGFGRDRMPYNEKVVGSASTLHVPTGLFLSVAAGQMNNLDNFLWPEGDTNRYYYIKSGILRNFTGLGDSVFYGEYYRIEKDVVDGCPGDCWTPGVDTTSQMWGAGFVQHIDAAAMELYAAYRFYDAPNGSLLIAPANRGDFHMIQVGTRIRF